MNTVNISIVPLFGTDEVLVRIDLETVSQTIDKVRSSPIKNAISQGAYGRVFDGTPTTVVKRTLLFDDGEYDQEENKKTQQKKLEGHEVIDSNIRELAFLKQYKHPNIANMIGYKIEEGKIYIALEKGTPMNKMWKKYTFQERVDMLPSILFQLVSAVEFLDRHGLYHQDIKPQNVVFIEKAQRLEVKLIDFGSIEFPNNLQSTSLATEIVRPPESFECDCPEAITCEKTYCELFSIKGDVFAVGITCLTWLCKDQVLEDSGKCFQRNLFLDEIELLDNKKYPIFDKLKKSVCAKFPSIWKILKRMTCLDPARRISARHLYQHKVFRGLRPLELSGSVAPEDHDHVVDPDRVRVTQERDIKEDRAVTVHWIAQVLKVFNSLKALTLTVSLLDTYLERERVKREKLQVTGCAAMILAVSMLDGYATIKHMVTLCDGAATHGELQKTIEHFIVVLDGKLWRNRLTVKHRKANWPRVKLICMSLSLFSNTEKASRAYIQGFPIITDLKIKGSKQEQEEVL